MKVKPQGFLLAISIGVARLRMRPRPRICLLPAGVIEMHGLELSKLKQTNQKVVV
jgi:hypothetical protein